MTVIAAVTYKIKPGQVEQLVQEMIDAKVEENYRKQPGNIAYNFSVPIEDKDTFYLVDIWESEEAFDAHRTCEIAPVWKEIKDRYVVDSDVKLYKF